MIKSLLYQIFI